MQLRFTYFIIVSLFILSAHSRLAAQHTTVEKASALKVKKDITFLVRKPDKAKNIATRFHIPFKTLAALNRPLRRRQDMYAGKSLVIPVWLKRKPSAISEDYDLADYELDIDSLDIYVREDFVCVAEIEADTARRKAIDKEIKRIDNKIAAINLVLDSIEEDGKQNLSIHEIRKMPMERARRAGRFTQGRQIDSLVTARKKITEERSKIDLRVADYEYLVENAPYMASHIGSEPPRVIEIKEWNDPKLAGKVGTQ
jgi:predicted RNA-binding protein with RPS1 domain